MSEADKNKAAFRRFVEEVPNKGNLEFIDKSVAEDVVWYIEDGPPLHGRDALKAMVEGSRAVFSDLRVQIEELIAEGDKLVARVTASGTNTGDYGGMGASGREATWTIVHIFRFRDGLIVEDRRTYDQLGVLQQLGFAPATTTAS